MAREASFPCTHNMSLIFRYVYNPYTAQLCIKYEIAVLMQSVINIKPAHAVFFAACLLV